MARDPSSAKQGLEQGLKTGAKLDAGHFFFSPAAAFGLDRRNNRLPPRALQLFAPLSTVPLFGDSNSPNSGGLPGTGQGALTMAA